MSSVLHILILGNVSLVYGKKPVTGINTARLQSLLAYLLLHSDAPQPRRHLAFLFWPDTTESQARSNLRQVLHQLRHALPNADSYIAIEANTLQWRREARYTLDANEFEQALARAHAAQIQHDLSAQRAALEQADGLYRADLLPSCYDEWVIEERERLRQQQLQALDHLVQLLQTQHDDDMAIHYAQRWIRIDPVAEQAYRCLMLSLAQHNDRTGALQVYHTCVTVLQRELGTEPSAATHDIYTRLLHPDPPLTTAIDNRPMSTAVSSLIGRQREWQQLQDCWLSATDGRPNFVLVIGEAGIGKSRLAEELLAWVGQQGFVVAKTRSYAAEGRLSLAPVAEWLRSEGLRPYLGQLDAVWMVEVARILPELLTEHPELPHYDPMTEYGQRQQFFEALGHAVLVAPQPLLLVIDNLQWCDQESLEWLHFLLRSYPAACLMILGMARTEETLPDHPLHTLVRHLHNEANVTVLALQPLDAAETAQLASQVGNRALDLQSAMRLYHQTAGNPLFVVETVRAGLEQTPDGDDLPPPSSEHELTLPPKVHAVIAERLAQVSSPTRDVLDLAATIGRAFTFELLASASNAGTDGDSVVRALDELWHKSIICECGQNSYDFTHDQLREMAYAEISVPQRRRLHQRIAEALVYLNADDLSLVNSQIASHYEQAGLLIRALPYYQRVQLK